jgi:uroporphyrin-III C-methyltransferase/precorrin-2 dehydrogenase/sirohydrochlorin ferrochelatase
MSLADVGLVSLVGAGPGDPDYLTQKAVRRLVDADLVLYDALVSDDVRRLARHAEQIYVGKRAVGEQTSQATIERLLIEGARQGRRVVRLKGGDPFVFGRGGEEALALQRAGVAYEVVPGISSAIAAPALAGIPVTHRGTSSAFLVVTGSDPSAYGPILDAVSPESITIVAMMSMASRDALAERLQAQGWRQSTPAAVVVGAATSRMWCWKGRLADLPLVVVPPDRIDAPGTIVIGEVVALPIAFPLLDRTPEAVDA